MNMSKQNNITRREIVKTLSLGCAAIIISPQTLLSACKMKKNKLGVALVGLGSYSTNLLAPALEQTKYCYLAGIVTGTPSKAVAWQKKYNLPDKNIYNYENFDEISNNPDIDVVYVVLPPSMHHEYTIRAANAGKHVWCEKPMALTELECQQMIDACNKNKKTLAIGYRIQHEPNTKEWRRIVHQKLLGNVKYVKCESGYREGRTDHWKQKKEMGGGALYDMGVYSIQGARMGTAMEPIEVVSASITTTRPEIYKEVDETTSAKLLFPNGVTSDIKTSFGENINELLINFEKGDLRMSPHQSYNGLKGSSPLGDIQHSYAVPWQQANQMDNDALSIINNKPMLVPGEEGLKDIRIVEAIYKAARTGKSVKL
jgi:glucose-fructose oxidoreductase